jgi:peptide/nickel transport system permease protein
MLQVIGRRIALAVPTLLGVTILVFLLMQVLPGDPAVSLLGADASAKDIAAVHHDLGLDQPLPVRYVKWLGNVAHGDLGYSLLRRRPISELLSQAWTNTAILAGFSALFGLITGAVFGIVAAIYRGRWVDRVLSTVTLVGLSVPSFWLGIILLIIFSSWLKVLPTTGTGLGNGPIDVLRHLIMPVLAGGLVTQGITARVTRASMVEAFEADFVATLRAKGMKARQILWHVLKNALNPILTTSGLQIGYLLGGQVLIETIFAWPGMGKLVFTAISGRDLLVVQGAMLVIACGFVVINLAVDIIQVLVNPSLRQVAA